jgi:NADH dehydrogenase FAD-containing subunit
MDTQAGNRPHRIVIVGGGAGASNSPPAWVTPWVAGARPTSP